MMKPVLFIALLALSGCADTRQYSLNEQCVREPGCVSTFSDHGGAPHAAAIAPSNAGQWEPIVKARKEPKKP
jgi:hypothetical protein